jgi:hypothetical protein
MGIFVINVDDAHLSVATDYLDQHGLMWHELKQEENADKGGEETCH